MFSDTLTTILVTAYLGAAGDHAALYQGQIETSFVQTSWTTHPYWDSNKFMTGDVCYDGNVYIAVPMRYNILENKLAVISPDGKLPIVPSQDKIEWFVLDGNRYERVNGWFMRIEFQGDNVTLLHNKAKYYVGDIQDGSRFYHNIEEIDRYYLRLADGTLHEVRNLKSLRKAVPLYRNELREHSRKYDLGFWQSARLESLKSCTELLDRLIPNVEPKAFLEIEAYPLSTCSSAMFDSFLSDVPDVKNVPVYQAYLAGSNAPLNYSEEEDMEISSPGIYPFNTQREHKTLEEIEVLGIRSKLSEQYGGLESFRPSLLRNIPLEIGRAHV